MGKIMKDDMVKAGYIKRIISKHIRYIKPAEDANESDKFMDFMIDGYEEIWDGKKWVKK